jgi:hypothetical protein
VRQKVRDVPPETRNHEVLPEKVILTPLHADVDFEPPEGKFNIWNIKVCQCRYIDEEGYFCGSPTGNIARSYCEEHHKRCNVPPSKLREPRR